MRSSILAFRQSVDAAADRNELFWARQRYVIHDRISQSRRVPFLRWATAAAAALIVFAMLLLTQTPKPQRAALEDSAADDVLLQQVESDIERDAPLALQPANLIAQAQTEALNTSSSYEHISKTR